MDGHDQLVYMLDKHYPQWGHDHESLFIVAFPMN